ncbi:MAG: bile acid:sodium symporter family protein [Planctomycetota bacterium]|jgi:sodium/bile acid cotransporter 7
MGAGVARWWFLPLLLIVLVGGPFVPGPGRGVSEHVDVLIVAVLFLMSVTLPLSRLIAAARNGRALLLSFAVTYVVVPASCLAAARLLFPGDAALTTGLLVLGALPCTLASAAVWTRLARGNDAVPVVFTALSNGLTFLVLPAILYATLRQWVRVDVFAMSTRLVVFVALPVVAGQVVRALFPRACEVVRASVSVVCRLLVLLIVLVAVSRASSEIRGDPLLVASLFLVALVVHLIALGAAGRGARALRIVGPDAVGTLFAASHKSLYVGVYVAAEFYPDLPGALIPLVAYHVTQLAVDTIVADRIAARS